MIREQGFLEVLLCPPAHRANALERMRDGGITVTNTESVVFEWMGDATHPQFKELSRMFR